MTKNKAWIQHDLWGEGKPLESQESSNGSDSRQSPVQIFCDSQSSAFFGLGLTLTLNPHPAVEPCQQEVVFESDTNRHYSAPRLTSRL